MFVMKLTAVLNARWFVTPGMSVGLNGRAPCSRWIAYSTAKEAALKAMTEKAYTVQRCSLDGSTRQIR